MPTTAVYLSPHYDDCCFSLGHTAKEGSGGHLVNIFSHSNYMAVPASSLGHAASTHEVTEIRDAEDREFANRCNLSRHNLNLPEATVLGLRPFDLSNIHQEVESLEKPLIHFPLSLPEKAKDSGAEIYCPMGIGRHRNHMSVFLAVVGAYSELIKKSRIFFYEDLPYASNPESRNEGIKRLAGQFQQSNITRHVNQLTPDEASEKLELISIYKSQHKGSIVQKNFFPANTSTPFPHEAFWEVTSGQAK